MIDITNVFDVVDFLITNDYKAVIEINNKKYYSSVHNMCFNYRDKCIFLPFVSKVEKKVYFKLMANSTDFSIFKFYVFKDKETDIEYVDLSNCAFIDGDFSLHTLYMYFQVASCKYRLKHNRYVDKEQYLIYNYNDIRLYDKFVLNTQFGISVDDTIDYRLRKYKFESYLLLHMLSNNAPIEVGYLEQFDKLGSSLRYFKYEEIDCFPMYIRYYYKLNNKMTALSYDRFIDVNTNIFV